MRRRAPERGGGLTRTVELSLDGVAVRAPEGSTILDVCRQQGIEVPTLCFLSTLTPVNACRVCVVEVERSRVLVPACSRPVEEGMVVQSDSERVRHSRRMVLELLCSSVDMSLVDNDVRRWIDRYQVDASRFGSPSTPAGLGDRDGRQAGHHHAAAPGIAETVAQPAKVDNDLYVRDYSRCILCYKCVEACGEDHQNTYAIAVAGRGFDARISTELDAPLTDSACVFCGNCIAVCPTGALMPKTEFDMRQAGTWDESRQTVTQTVCSFCGVGCNLELRVQDNRIVRVDSPLDHDVTLGNLCIKGRFGFEHVQNLEDEQPSPTPDPLP
jgi:NADP-reducing hydrogenase subunit HndD